MFFEANLEENIQSLKVRDNEDSFISWGDAPWQHHHVTGTIMASAVPCVCCFGEQGHAPSSILLWFLSESEQTGVE